MGENNWKKRDEGITLISLVVSIVVLLILAGTSISMVIGNNGIITKAQDAKIKTALGAVKEELALEQTNDYIENTNTTVEQMLAEGKVQRTIQAEGDVYYMYYALKSGSYQGMR